MKSIKFISLLLILCLLCSCNSRRFGYRQYVKIDPAPKEKQGLRHKQEITSIDTTKVSFERTAGVKEIKPKTIQEYQTKEVAAKNSTKTSGQKKNNTNFVQKGVLKIISQSSSFNETSDNHTLKWILKGLGLLLLLFLFYLPGSKNRSFGEFLLGALIFFIVLIAFIFYVYGMVKFVQGLIQNDKKLILRGLILSMGIFLLAALICLIFLPDGVIYCIYLLEGGLIYAALACFIYGVIKFIKGIHEKDKKMKIRGLIFMIPFIIAYVLLTILVNQ